MGTRSYRQAVVLALHVMSAGSCYWPSCPVRSVTIVENDPEIAVDIAHICALNPGGPRYDATMSVSQRNAYANLILLCKPHHKRIDARATEFSAEMLQGWKDRVEAEHREAFEALASEPWTAETLEQAMTDVLATRADRLDDAIRRLEHIDLQSAALLRSLIDELEAARLLEPSISADDVDILASAAGRLARLEDTAEVLGHAADQLAHLADSASVLADAAYALNGLDESSARLNRVAGQIDSAVARAEDLRF